MAVQAGSADRVRDRTLSACAGSGSASNVVIPTFAETSQTGIPVFDPNGLAQVPPCGGVCGYAVARRSPDAELGVCSPNPASSSTSTSGVSVTLADTTDIRGWGAGTEETRLEKAIRGLGRGFLNGLLDLSGMGRCRKWVSSSRSIPRGLANPIFRGRPPSRDPPAP
jgi:hypothetical protein